MVIDADTEEHKKSNNLRFNGEYNKRKRSEENGEKEEGEVENDEKDEEEERKERERKRQKRFLERLESSRTIREERIRKKIEDFATQEISETMIKKMKADDATYNAREICSYDDLFD